MHRVKRIVAFLVSVILLLLLLCACSNKASHLSDVDDGALRRYMADCGITVPETVEMNTVRGMLAQLEEDTNHPAPVLGWTVMADLYEDLRGAVIAYEAQGT